jgi:hypothetical protein
VYKWEKPQTNEPLERPDPI